jgi:hypothetical protein
MSDMGTEAQHAKPPPPAHWTWPQRLYAEVLATASLGTSVPAGYEIYRTSTGLARPYIGTVAWILPVACEAAYMVLFGWGVLLAWRKAADVPARLAGTAAIAVMSFVIQVYAGHKSFADIMVRLAIVASFFVTGLTMKAAFMRLRGGKIRGDRVSLGEWLASPPRAFGLWRWKNAWAEPSAARARDRYLILLYVIALAQAAVAQAGERAGHPRRSTFRWRRRLPVTLRYELSTGLLPADISAGGEGWQDAAERHVTRQLALMDHATPDATAPRQGDAAEAAINDATPDASDTPPSPPAGRQRARQPTVAERARKDATVRRLLKDKPEWTLAAVADKAGVSERTVSRIKNAAPERPSLRVARGS